jgi:hypothetical protein
MKSTAYILEVYEPGSDRNVWVRFETSSPFMNLNVGDIVKPRATKEAEVNAVYAEPTTAVRVTSTGCSPRHQPNGSPIPTATRQR